MKSLRIITTTKARMTKFRSYKQFCISHIQKLVLTITIISLISTIPTSEGISVANVTSFSLSKMSYIRENDSLTTWTSEKDTPIRRLTKDLLFLYDPNVRPVLNFSSALNVTHYFLLQQVSGTFFGQVNYS